MDFQELIRRRYTSADRLAIEGGSNGGLLMGAALTQRPDLFKAVVSHVGIYDMLRVELAPNGAFNVPEFGTVKDPEQFGALFACSRPTRSRRLPQNAVLPVHRSSIFMRARPMAANAMSPRCMRRSSPRSARRPTS